MDFLFFWVAVKWSKCSTLQVSLKRFSCALSVNGGMGLVGIQRPGKTNMQSKGLQKGKLNQKCCTCVLLVKELLFITFADACHDRKTSFKGSRNHLNHVHNYFNPILS